MNPEEKKKLYKRIDEKTQVVSNPTTINETINSWVNGFPKELYSKWRADCQKFYNDIFWVKIWSDHLKAQAYDNLINNAVQKSELAEEEEKDENDLDLIGDPNGVTEEKENGKQL